MDSDRLAALEERMAKLETVVEDAQARLKAFANGPGKKLMKMFGVQLP